MGWGVVRVGVVGWGVVRVWGGDYGLGGSKGLGVVVGRGGG